MTEAEAEKMARQMSEILADPEVIEIALHAAKEGNLRLSAITKTAAPGKGGATLLMAQVLSIGMINSWLDLKGIDRDLREGLVEVAEKILKDIRNKNHVR